VPGSFDRPAARHTDRSVARGLTARRFLSSAALARDLGR
jgi:hypothetical protein